jgi:restriction system protein
MLGISDTTIFRKGTDMSSRRAWVIRPPKNGNFDERALRDNIVTAEFGVREDLSDHIEYDMVHEEVVAVNTCEAQTKIDALSRQLNVLLNDIQSGDLVLHPHDRRRMLAIGIVKPGVTQDADGRPAREVEWLRQDIPKSALRPDLQHSFSAGAQISEMSRNNAVPRIEALVADGVDPGPSLNEVSTATMSTEAMIADLEARTLAHVGALCAGHDLAHLVAALLEVEGYQVRVMPPGPDGGCDFTAARGGLGIEGPTLVGQVKSGDITVDHATFQALRGTIQSRGADKGMLVSWSGVTRPVARELEMLHLQIAYWDGREICRRLIAHYDEMPVWVRDRLKIRRVPVLTC